MVLSGFSSELFIWCIVSRLVLSVVLVLLLILEHVKSVLKSTISEDLELHLDLVGISLETTDIEIACEYLDSLLFLHDFDQLPGLFHPHQVIVVPNHHVAVAVADQLARFQSK